MKISYSISGNNHLGFKFHYITKNAFIPEHENRFSPLVSMDAEAEDITEIGDTTFVEVQRSTKPKASKEAID